MPDTPIDQAPDLTSIRLKVPTGTVPIPPEGYGQLHSPAEGELAIRLHDGSVVAVGGGGDFAVAARNLLGPNGQILTDGTDPTVGIDITPIPPLPIRLSGPVQDQEGLPFGMQVAVVPISSAELLALHETNKRVLDGVAGVLLVPLHAMIAMRQGTVSYTAEGAVRMSLSTATESNGFHRWKRSDVAAILTLPGGDPGAFLADDTLDSWPDTVVTVGAPLEIYTDAPLADGDGTAIFVLWYQAVVM